jgi:copper chaperone
MHCGSCVRHVSDVLKAISGVIPLSVEVGSAEVEYDPAVASPNAVATALTQAGYPARSRVSPLQVSAAAKPAGKTTNGGGCGCCG